MPPQSTQASKNLISHKKNYIFLTLLLLKMKVKPPQAFPFTVTLSHIPNFRGISENLQIMPFVAHSTHYSIFCWCISSNRCIMLSDAFSNITMTWIFTELQIITDYTIDRWLMKRPSLAQHSTILWKIPVLLPLAVISFIVWFIRKRGI